VCPGPLKNREFFYKVMSGYHNASQTPLSDMFLSLAASRRVIVFIGDSLMLQNVAAFLCEASRERITLSSKYDDNSCQSVHSVLDVKGREGSEIHFYRIGRLSTISQCERNKQRLRNGTGTWPFARDSVEKMINVRRKNEFCGCMHSCTHYCV
jgi:hypothetical protein